MSLPTDVRETTPLRPIRKPASARPKGTTKVWCGARSGRAGFRAVRGVCVCVGGGGRQTCVERVGDVRQVVRLPVHARRALPQRQQLEALHRVA